MPKTCIVPGCRYGCRTFKGAKRSIFQLPKDPKLRSRWLEAISPGEELSVSQNARICDAHFEKECIIRTYEATMEDGSVMNIPRLFPKLAEGTIPSIFDMDLIDGTSNSPSRTVERREAPKRTPYKRAKEQTSPAKKTSNTDNGTPAPAVSTTEEKKDSPAKEVIEVDRNSDTDADQNPLNNLADVQAFTQLPYVQAKLDKSGWKTQIVEEYHKIVCYRLSASEESGVLVSHSVQVDEDMSVKLWIHGLGTQPTETVPEGARHINSSETLYAVLDLCAQYDVWELRPVGDETAGAVEEAET